MSKLWLPFYDLGAPIGPGQPNHPLDIELFVFLSSRLRPMMRVPNLPAIAPVRKMLPDGKPAPAYSEEWLTALVKYCISAGYAVQLSPPNVIAPMTAGGALIVAMNALYHRFWPDEFMSPTFTQATSGSLTLGTLPYHMLSTGNMRSPWLGVAATGPGPKREMPFYDVNTVTYADPNNSTQVADPVVTQLLKVLCASNSIAKPPSIGSIGPYAAISAHAIITFGKHFQQLGWICTDYANVHPTYGNIDSSSLITPINYYAWEGNAYGTGGLAAGGYINMLNANFLPPSLPGLLKANRWSRYFSI